MGGHEGKWPVDADNGGSILSKGVVGVGRARDCQPVGGAAGSNLAEEINFHLLEFKEN